MPRVSHLTMKRGWISVSKPSGEDEKLSPVKEVPPKSPLQTKKEKELKDKTIGKYVKITIKKYC